MRFFEYVLSTYFRRALAFDEKWGYCWRAAGKGVYVHVRVGRHGSVIATTAISFRSS